MPELAAYPQDPAVLDGLADGERSRRSQEIKVAVDYYHGRFPRPLKVRKGQYDDNVIVNLSRKVINQSAALLFGRPLSWEIPDLDQTDTGEPGPEAPDEGMGPDQAMPDGGQAPDQASAGGQDTSPEEQALEALWRDNQGEIWQRKLGVRGGLGGHVFVKLVEDPLIKVRFVALRSELVSAFWLPDDWEQVLVYMIKWEQGNGSWRRQDIVRQEPEGERWLIRDMSRGKGAMTWTLTGEESWPWPFAPVVDWQNLPNTEDFYGIPDLTNAGLNNSLNFVASNTARILKQHAHPKTIGTGMEPNEVVETPVDGFFTVPNPDAKVYNLEMQSDLASSMAFMTFLREGFYSEHNAVDMAAIKDQLGNMTNFGLQMIFNDALDKLAMKRGLYGAGLAEVGRRGLMMLGQRDVKPEPRWSYPLPVNLPEQVTAEQGKVAMGVESKETAATNLDLDWDEEQRRMENEGAGQDNLGARLLQAFERGGTAGNLPGMAARPQPMTGGQNAQAQMQTGQEAVTSGSAGA